MEEMTDLLGQIRDRLDDLIAEVSESNTLLNSLRALVPFRATHPSSCIYAAF